MKVVILAAGKGSRLGQGNLPKPLTLLDNGKSILAYQLEVLSHFISLDQVIVVVGYQKEKVMEAFPKLLYVYNPDYAVENTSKSLLKALYKIDEEVLWLNGDVVFHPDALKAVLKQKKSCMMVNIGPVGAEEVKYRQNGKGAIIEISKQVLHAQGEALGINFCSKKDLHRFRCSLEACSPHDYFEKGMEMCIQQGMQVMSVPVDAALCTEIDFPEDLQRANRMLIEWD